MIRILLAEHVSIVRGALVALLAFEPDIAVVAEVESADLVVPTARASRPDVAVIDADLYGRGDLSPADAAHTEQLRAEVPECRVLLLTDMGRTDVVRRSLLTRVDGFLLKDAPPAYLAEAIRRLAAGERVLDSDLMLSLWDSRESPLTRRETEVLRRVATGDDVPEIASTLFLAAGTVRNHLSSAVTKLRARNRVDAIRIASEAGWI